MGRIGQTTASIPFSAAFSGGRDWRPVTVSAGKEDCGRPSVHIASERGSGDMEPGFRFWLTRPEALGLIGLIWAALEESER